MKRKIDISPEGTSNSPKCRNMLYTSIFRGIPGFLERNVHFSLHSYMLNFYIFHLLPVLLKILKETAKKRRVEFFCPKKLRSFFFLKTLVKIGKIIFSMFWKKTNRYSKTNMEHFRCKMDVWCLWKGTKCENRNSPGPSPTTRLNRQFVQNQCFIQIHQWHM